MMDQRQIIGLILVGALFGAGLLALFTGIKALVNLLYGATP
jgi:hypothetical protein